MNPNEEETFLSTREAAEMLDVNYRTIQNWVEKGLLKAWKTPGGHRRIAKSSVDNTIKRRKQSMEKKIPLKQQSVLVVEDEEALREIYQVHFDFWGFDVHLRLAKNGMEGLFLIGRKKPDLIITDLVMPDMDGFSMLKTLAKEEQYANIHLVVMTRLTEEEIAQEGGIPEGIKVFHKPIIFEQLEYYLQRFLRKKSS